MPRKKPRAPSTIVKPKRATRFKAGRKSGELALSRLVSLESAGIEPPRVLLVVAHPDDECIGAGALLADIPDAMIVHVTDGAPRADGAARKRGFASRDAYAAARREEVVNALAHIGIPETRIRCLGFVDGEATLRLVELCHDVIDLILELGPEILLTHPYEGGHTDHDATAFAVHMATGILRREGVASPVVLEHTSYHSRNGKRVRAKFLPRKNVPEMAHGLSPDAQMLKLRMFEEFLSQRDCLREFPIEVERFRVAPRYDFTSPPHEGTLDYERFCTTICGDEWRARASRALDLLRARGRVTPPPVM
jgi:LmbE family N-acetylglucosaminyl deacetylase